ncbi:S-layer family protein [Flavobacterium sp. ASW18X]|uniref:beta strand repeat-containing protein n=1 Tax=Flavobacterium sp. ASW18X TaxID=2572595 RepID=UPI0010AE19F6|nr:Calx-beta domain-containing protein [Flavobacterium sp. ASW18X]TKD55272.1 sodium:calcium exchanger [Flavobacterium sp. ASW18X]
MIDFKNSTIIIILFLVSQLGFSQESYLDDFNTVSYSNNNGTRNFNSDWIESNDVDSGPTGQNIYIASNRLTFYNLSNQSIRRGVDLTSATSASLNFSWQTSGLNGSKNVIVEISSNGSNFFSLGNFNGNNNSGNFNININQHISSNTVIRIRSGGNNWDNNDFAYIDNFRINATFPSPFLNVEDVAVDETAGSVTLTVEQLGSSTSAYTVNYETIIGSATSPEDYTYTTGVLNFNGNVNDTEIITIPITSDGIIEGDEDFSIVFTSVSNTDVDITDTATITINSQIPFDQPLVLFDQFAGYVDYTSTAGSFRTLQNSATTTDACAITNTSSNTLFSAVPNTATIKKAYLYWAHSSYVLDDTVTFEGQSVTASRIYESAINSGTTTLTHFGYVADVTSIIDAIGVVNLGSNTFDVTDLTIDSGSPFCETATVLGGWTLMVFYEEPSLPASNINLYEGFDGLNNAGNSFTLDSFFAIAGAGSKASFLSWEGDATLDGSSTGSTNPEELSITNQSGFNFVLSGDGGQTGNNAYNSTAYDNTQSPIVNDATLYGVDWDTFDISTYIAPSNTEVTANVNVGQDYIISNAVVIKVPSNLVTGFVFEDINYPGGTGRNRLNANGEPLEGVTVELYNSFGNIIRTTTTDANGQYIFGGMADGSYSVRVVNETVNSTRIGGSSCTTCYGVQTFRSFHNGTGIVEVGEDVGGANPAQEDVPAGSLIGAQSVSTVILASNGIVGIDFGFNFNTIVNTNESGQGSYEQFIINSNNLGQISLDIEPNSIFDPQAGEDVSIFMIPTSGDLLGRTADPNYTNGYFDIFYNNTYTPSQITDNNTIVDGRTQTAYSGDTNVGTVGAGGTTVGVTGLVLPNYNLPEIQIHRNAGNVIKVAANAIQIRNLSVFANNNAAIRINSGDVVIRENLLGVNAQGTNVGNVDYGINNVSGDMLVDSNYIATNTVNGVLIAGGNSSQLIRNHITTNGITSCDDNIRINGGSGIEIIENLIENAASIGIDAASSGNIQILNNTITGSGQNGGNCGTAPEQMGIELGGSNSVISGNVIHNNGGSGLATTGNGIANLFSQNSFYANGASSQALGIDLAGDGVTLNDLNDIDTGSNNFVNFPLISAAYISGNSIIVKGWASPNVQMEFFFTDVNEGTATAGDNQLGTSQDYGEGQLYIGTVQEGSAEDLDATTAGYTDTDGNTDNTNRFHISLPLPSGTQLGDMITATATISNSTSEFSPSTVIKVATVITNRRITDRVNQ